MAGKSAKGAPVAALLLHAFAVPAEVTPTAKGVPVEMTGSVRIAPTALGPELRVVSRVAGTLTLSGVDVVWRPVIDLVTQPSGPVNSTA